MSRQSATLGDNDAKCPDAEIDDAHTRNSLASPLYLQEREASASLLCDLSLTKRNLVSTCTGQFFCKYGDDGSSVLEFRNYRMKSIVCMTQETVRMPSQYELGYPTFPVNQRYFHFIVIQGDC